MFEDEIERKPLKYSKESPTDYRRDRLPAETDYADMNLADVAPIKPVHVEETKSQYVLQLLMALPAAMVLAFLGPFIPLPYLLPLSFAVSCFLLIRAILPGSPKTLASIAMAIAAPPILVTLSYNLGKLFAYRHWAAMFLAVPAFVSLVFLAKIPFSLWQDALRNNVHVPPERRDGAAPIPYRVDILFTLLVILVAVFAPIWSSFLAQASLLLLVFSFLGYRFYRARANDPRVTLSALLSVATDIAVFPPAYRAQYRAYPGVWSPQDQLRRAEKVVYATLISWAVFLAVASSGYFAWDMPFFRSRILDLFHGAIPRESIRMDIVSHCAPATDWTRLPPVYTPPEGAMSAEQLWDARLTMRPDERRAAIKKYGVEHEQRLLCEARINQFVTPALNGSPYLWFYLSLMGFFTGEFYFTVAWLLALLFAILLPPAILMTALFRPLCSALALKRELRPAEQASDEDEDQEKSEEDKRTVWDHYVKRLSSSTHATKDPIIPGKIVREAEHLFMGHNPSNGFPVILDRDILKQHAYIIGGTGFGKTSLGIMPLVMQLIRGHRGKNGLTTPMPPMLIIDLKGDKALFHTVKVEVERKAKQEGRSLTDAFRVFSCEVGHACHSFNPFGVFGEKRQGMVEICNVYLDALNLNHGEGYGRSYYTMQSRAFLHEVLKTDNPKTFKELYQAMCRPQRTKSKAFREAFELVATIEALSDYEHIYNPVKHDNEPIIDMHKAVREHQVIYFWLPAAEHSLTAKEIASLALYAFYNSLREWVNSGEWKTQGKPRPEGFLVIDEFQRVASRNFPNILREARSFGLGTILAHQSASDLDLPDVDLGSIVRENTRVKLFFAIQDPKERKLFSEMSGDEIAIQKTVSRPYTSDFFGDFQATSQMTISETPVIKPRITKNDIIETGDHPFEYFMLASQGSGYTQFGGYPITVRTMYPLSTPLYEARKDQPWPTKEELGLLESSQVTTTPIEDIDDKLIEMSSNIDATIEALFREDPTLLQ